MSETTYSIDEGSKMTSSPYIRKTLKYSAVGLNSDNLETLSQKLEDALQDAKREKDAENQPHNTFTKVQVIRMIKDAIAQGIKPGEVFDFVNGLK
jgi:hypothetical protein